MIIKDLFPRARAWLLRRYGVFYQLFEALGLSENRALQENYKLIDSVIPDNDNFTIKDAERYERALGLYNSTGLSLSDRKVLILEKIKYPGEMVARQHRLYLQKRIQEAGFDLYVHKNTTPDYLQASLYGSIRYGDAMYGDNSISGSQVLANYVDKLKDNNYLVGNLDSMKMVFLIGGAVSGDFADIDISREQELRQLILRIKPAQTVGILLINYI